MSRARIWWRATRPFAFPASVIPALLGGMVAVVHAGARLDLFAYLLAAFGAACVHAAANLLSDYYDFRQGVDRPDTVGASRGMLVTGRMTPREILSESFVLWVVAVLIGLYFLLRVGAPLVPLLAGGLILGAGYTAAPTRLKYRALGDVSVFLAFGVGITVGSYVVQTGRLSWTPVYYSLPMGLLIWAILHANNLRDIASDRRAAITTLAMALGPARSRSLYIALLLAAYLSMPICVLAGVVQPVALLSLLSLPLALGAVRQLRQGPAAAAAGGLITLDIRTAQLQMAFGLLLIVGLALRAVF